MILAAFLGGLTVGAALMFGGLLLYARMVGESASELTGADPYLAEEVRRALHPEKYEAEWPHIPRDGSRGRLKP